jgi:uncharacterized protein (TIGR03435 family)
MIRLASRLLGIILALTIVHTLTAQTSPTLSFEAASIKPNVTNAIGGRLGMPAGRVVATNEPLSRLIAVAYGTPGRPLSEALPHYRIAGGPNWATSDRFDVEAKVAEGVVRGTEAARRMQLMLQTLLAQRFKLAVHHETRQLPVYALVLARRDRRLGPTLRRSQVDPSALRADLDNASAALPAFGTPRCEASGGRCSPGLIPGGFKASAVTMVELAPFFSRWLDRAVLDRTGLTGVFDAELQFSFDGLQIDPGPPGVERPANDNPSIFIAVEEQLGLKLQSTRGPVDVLVIDHAEKPTEN